MAGLVAAARLRGLGHEPRVVEKGTRAGGSMLLSSCVVWRHLEWERFRAECPGGDELLQRLIWERLDDSPRSRSSTVARHASSATTGARSRRPRSGGTRTTSRSLSVLAPGTWWRRRTTASRPRAPLVARSSSAKRG